MRSLRWHRLLGLRKATGLSLVHGTGAGTDGHGAGDLRLPDFRDKLSRCGSLQGAGETLRQHQPDGEHAAAGFGTASKKILRVLDSCGGRLRRRNVAVVEGTGSVCATGTAGVSGFGGATAATGWNFAGNGGIALGNGETSSLGARYEPAATICASSSMAPARDKFPAASAMWWSRTCFSLSLLANECRRNVAWARSSAGMTGQVENRAAKSRQAEARPTWLSNRVVTCLPRFLARATTYYVDADCGHSKKRLEQRERARRLPWLTVAHVNAQSFNPGDSVLFERTCAWYGTSLTVPSGGLSGSPITFGAYGTGANPILKGSTVLNTSGYVLDTGITSAPIYGPLVDSGTSSTDSATRNWRLQVAHANITAGATAITITVTA